MKNITILILKEKDVSSFSNPCRGVKLVLYYNNIQSFKTILSKDRAFFIALNVRFCYI